VTRPTMPAGMAKVPDMPATTAGDVSLADAIRAFVVPFATSKSIRHPYLASDLGGSRWRMADAERKRVADYRSEEWVGLASDAVGTVEEAEATTRGRWNVCLLLPEGQDDAEMRSAMRTRGHKLMSTEAMMVRPLAGRGSSIASATSGSVEVTRLTTAAQTDELTRATRRRQFLPEWIEGDRPLYRQFLAHLDGELVGWVASMRLDDLGSVRNLYVARDHRRLGIGSALMTRMLQDDKRNGLRASTLLASHTGAMLYPRLGYRRIGTLFIYTGTRG
jgi:GNAT superfamily N-acetyltransferase